MINKMFSYPMLIKEFHLDSFGHVNNAMYLTILEEARWEFVTQNNYGLKRIHEIGLGPIILEIKLVFLRELRLREEIIIESRLVSYENKIGKIAQKIMRQDEECLTAELIIALFDLKQRKIIPPTQEWLTALGCA